MFFNSFQFFTFLCFFLGVYYLTPQRAKSALILLASLFFYACWDFRFLGLILLSTVVDYVVGLKLHASERPKIRKWWVTLSLTVNLGLLGVFKYLNFFIENASDLLSRVGLSSLDGWTLQIVLPVGISFYTFQTLSYTLDIYRKELKPTRNFIDFAAFVSFFPQLVAGPIERASHLLPQIQSPPRPTADQLKHGGFLLLWGLFEKVVVADNLAKLTDAGFANPNSGLETLIALYSFAFQVFADFDGYSNMARGMAALMGFKLFHNFNAPYFAVNPSEYWKRWHITLSTWLRDYLYIPLGGNRKGTLRTYSNLATVMVLGGLWHGASWNFVIWGAIHGGMLGFERAQGKDSFYRHLPGPVKTAITFVIVCFAWVFFRAETLPQALAYCEVLIGLGDAVPGSDLIAGLIYQPYYVISLTVAALVTWCCPQTWDFTGRITWPRAALALGLFWASLIVLTTQAYNPFIYFIF